MNDRIGFIGLGMMGQGMAMRIAGAGLPLMVFDTSESALEPFREKDSAIGTSAREVADWADVVIVCLPSVAASLSVAKEVSGGRSVHTYIETSTIGPQAMSRVSELFAGAGGIEVLDAPISNGKEGAAAGTLTSICGGRVKVLEKVRPVLECYSTNIFHVGDYPGAGQTAKLVNNMLSAASLMVAFEGMVMGVKAGLDAQALLDVINTSTGRSEATMVKFPRTIMTRIFGGRISTGAKDLDLYLAEAERVGAPVRIAPALRALYAEAADQGGVVETHRIIEYLEKLAGGVEVRAKKADE